MLPEYATVVRYATIERQSSTCRDQYGGRLMNALLKASRIVPEASRESAREWRGGLVTLSRSGVLLSGDGIVAPLK